MQEYKEMYLKLFTAISQAHSEIAVVLNFLNALKDRLEIVQARTEQIFLDIDASEETGKESGGNT